MIYLVFDYVNPFILTLVFCPLISVLLGAWFAMMRKKKLIALVVSFVLPLLYITSDWNTFIANLGAWLLWGTLYALVAYLAHKAVSIIRGKSKK
ncbi:hypothetical protein DNHGIG_00090 [Collibacillus ludicampi]|uniref:DUF2651 domain-containing protein n=1 Tax=Collibacillus ludicampi TaxID=2771369 RepID=A0AAV4L9K9_9BACL|nr:hypothetical protein [Collibacillus ludicampi]GIM44460.1 hypothetical protein DNHGIG_00090 [Collibacillus ludicampi]